MKIHKSYQFRVPMKQYECTLDRYTPASGPLGLRRPRSNGTAGSLRGCGVYVFLKIALVLLVAAPSRGGPETTFERWYSVMMQGQPVGWIHAKQTEQQQRIISEDSTHIQIRRGKFVSTIEMNSQFVETVDGKPIESIVQKNLGLLQTKNTARYKADGIEMVVEQSGQSHRQVLPRSSQTWFPPAAALRYVEQQISHGAQEIRFWAVDPMIGVEPVESRMLLRGWENVEVLGKVVPAMAWDVKISMLPGIVSRFYTDEKGRYVKSTTDVFPGLSFDMVLADEQTAKAKVNPPELLVSTFIRPDKPITNPRHQRSAIYHLTFADPKSAETTSTDEALQFAVPRTGYQRVVWDHGRKAAVIVSLDEPVSPGKDLPNDSHRRVSSTLNHEDPKVRALVRAALVGAPENVSTAAKAERLRQFVRDYVQKKDLRVGFATATEVARTAQGDCTEHAVLLAAMLRAERIPSRTVGGLIYVDKSFLGHDNIFGYHMWTQAWLPTESPDRRTVSRWIDLDATLGVPFDATHIALSMGAMDDHSTFNDLVQMAPMIGRLSIKVVQIDGS